MAIVTGTAANDILVGTLKNDTLDGLTGADKMSGPMAERSIVNRNNYIYKVNILLYIMIDIFHA